MREACVRFEQYLKRRFGQSSTPIHYISDLNIFHQTINDKKPEAVSVTDIDTFIDHQIANGRSPATINRRISTLHSLFEFLAGEKPELRWPNPVIQRRHQIKTGSRLPRDVTDEDVSKLFAIISDERDQAMFGLMVGAGLRVGEVATLHLENVEAPIESDGLARLRVCGKGNKERIV